MKLNFKGRREKGITLIALVITIIVLLILAGVTIATLTGDNGILTKANEAKTITNEKDEEEQIEIGYTEYLMADQTGEKVDFKVSEAKVTGKEGDWIIRFNKTGKEYYFDGETITKVTWEQKGDTITNIETKQTLKVGDYVDYDPKLEANASDLTYTSKTDKTGADSDQEFNAETYKNAEYGWRILGVSKGKLRLISGEFVGAGNYTNGSRTYYTLKGQKGYINGIEELNKISAIFGHGTGKRVQTVYSRGYLLLCICTIFLAGSTDPLSGICSVQSKVTCHAWRNRLMLKVRLMGTKNDIAWFQKILQRHPKIEVMELSELYSNKGTSKYYRAYAEIEKSNVNKK